MKRIRLAITAFVVVLVTLSVIGWVWTGANQPPAQSAASHVVLALGIIAGLVGLTAIWRYSQDA